MKTLVVDDELVSRKKMQAILRNISDCQAVNSGKEAIALFKDAMESESHYDLICLDIDMPDMDGITVLKSIRKIEEEKGISKEKRGKVVMVSSSSDKTSVVECLKAGCDSYVLKPFDKETVYSKLKALGIGKEG